MMAKTHMLIGISYGMALLPAVTTGDYTPAGYVAILSGLVVGSLAPDLDHPQSLASQMIPFVGGVISKLVGHRNVLHSLLAVVALFFINGVVVRMFPIPEFALFSSSILIGYGLHIIADMMTKNGVKLFYPIRWSIGLKLMTTNGLIEIILRWLLVFYCGVQIMRVFI